MYPRRPPPNRALDFRLAFPEWREHTFFVLRFLNRKQRLRNSFWTLLDPLFLTPLENIVFSVFYEFTVPLV